MEIGIGINLFDVGATAGEVAWTPAQLSNLAVWYDPSDISTLFKDSTGLDPVTADLDLVGKILDKSGNNYHLIQTTTAAKPTYKTDQIKPSLLFSGSHTISDCAAAGKPAEIFGAGISHYIFAAGRLTNPSGFRNMLTHAYNFQGFAIGVNTATALRHGIGPGTINAYDVKSDMASVLNEDHILGGHFDRSSGDSIRYRDGVIIETKAALMAIDLGFNVNDRLCMGGQVRFSPFAIGNFWLGNGYETGIIYNPSAEDITNINEYLKTKYGVA